MNNIAMWIIILLRSADARCAKVLRPPDGQDARRPSEAAIRSEECAAAHPEEIVGRYIAGAFMV